MRQSIHFDNQQVKALIALYGNLYQVVVWLDEKSREQGVAEYGSQGIDLEDAIREAQLAVRDYGFCAAEVQVAGEPSPFQGQAVCYYGPEQLEPIYIEA